MLLEPKFYFIAIRVSDVSEGKARREFATMQELTARALNLGDGGQNVQVSR